MFPVQVTQKEMRTLSGRFQSSPHKQRSSVRDSSWHRDISVDREEPGQRTVLGAEGKDKLDGKIQEGVSWNKGGSEYCSRLFVSFYKILFLIFWK